MNKTYTIKISRKALIIGIAVLIVGIIAFIGLSRAYASDKYHYTPKSKGKMVMKDSETGSEIIIDTDDLTKISEGLNDVSDQLVAQDGLESVPFRFGIDENGHYGYYKNGEDVVTPFEELSDVEILEDSFVGSAGMIKSIPVSYYPVSITVYRAETAQTNTRSLSSWSEAEPALYTYLYGASGGKNTVTAVQSQAYYPVINEVSSTNVTVTVPTNATYSAGNWRYIIVMRRE